MDPDRFAGRATADRGALPTLTGGCVATARPGFYIPHGPQPPARRYNAYAAYALALGSNNMLGEVIPHEANERWFALKWIWNSPKQQEFLTPGIRLLSRAAIMIAWFSRSSGQMSRMIWTTSALLQLTCGAAGVVDG